MKKLILTKTAIKAKGETDCTALLDRKSMMPHFKKLFEVLFNFPDKKVAAIVLEAINNTEKESAVCSRCLQAIPKVTSIDCSTQTEIPLSTDNTADSRDVTPTTSVIIKALDADKRDTNLESSPKDEAQVAVKRKRRRKIQLPKVIKISQAQLQQERNKPILQKRKAFTLQPNYSTEKDNRNIANVKRSRQDSMSSTVFPDLFEDEMFKEFVTQKDILHQMTDEILKTESIQEDGLLPIHSAIVNNDSKQLERQILAWKLYKKEDLNDILTDDNEDCLQLAVVEKSSSGIVKVLLCNGLNADCRDANSNTILHLAILNEASIDILCLLMEKVNMETFFVLNYDGYSALHLAVRGNQYLLAEVFLDMFDKRLLGIAHYVRKKEPDEKHFLNYYENFCERVKLQNFLQKYPNHHFKKKRKLLDVGDARSGNTCLLYAVENKCEHLIYFLLAHLADPGAQNLSGQSPNSFVNEYAKSLNLSLRIDQVMQNVVFLLNK